MSREDLKRSWKPWLRGTLLGFPIGCLPTGGAEIPTFLSYSLERRLSKHPEEFGHGAIEGVAGPEAANNAAAAGVPMARDGSCNVDQLHHRAAQDEAKRVCVVR